MAHVPLPDFDAFVAARREPQHATSGAAPREPSYAYASDQQTHAAFARVKPVELAVRSSVRMFREVWRGQLLGNAVKVSERQFVRLHGIGRECAQTLGIAPPTLYVMANPTLNAATYGTDDESFIMVHSALVDHYTDDELRMVIGHECGHIHNSHVVYLTALTYLTRFASAFIRWIVEPATLALRAWSRRAEITCDRAGMLCVKDLPTAERALTKLVLGSRKLYDEFNLEAFLDQYREGQGSVGRYLEVFASHPWLPKRVLAMREFAQSEVYLRALGGAGGRPIDEVDRKVSALLKGAA